MDAVDDWATVFGVSELKNTADASTSRDKVQIEYLRAVLHPGKHYSVSIKGAEPNGAGVDEVA